MKNIALITLTVYQKIISPLLHQLLGITSGCRNNPTCSVYSQQVINRYGVFKGTLLSVRRLVNCQPFFSL